MLSCVVMILSIMGIKNRKSSVGARIVASDFTEQVKLDGPQAAGDAQEKSRGPEKEF